ISAFGEVWGFGLNAILRFAVIIALVLIRAVPRQTEKGAHGWLNQLAEGFRYAFGFVPSRSALLLLAAVSISVQPYQSLAPYFARDVFHGDSRTLGFLIGAGGFGAVSGMIYLALRTSVRGLLRLIPLSGGVAGLALIGFSFAPTLGVGLVMLYFVGMGAMLTGAATNTVLQSIVEDRMRARVMSIYMACFFGMSPIGALVAGSLAERIGPPAALACGGALAVCAALVYLANFHHIRSAIRPVYQKLGIVPGPEQ
ncbi:MAG TPA: MFS transporter, partial [Burkholderiales bacterium]|nr:MFS transporter [Burkholderiales bacterium]